MEEKYAELEKRVQVLEELLKGFLQSEDNNISLALKDCSINNLDTGDECDIRLDNCSVGIKAGSKDMAKYITESGAYMSLHGHIHESPDVSGVWRAKLGNTVCIQPGQSELGEKSFTYVIIDTDKDTQERFIKM